MLGGPAGWAATYHLIFLAAGVCVLTGLLYAIFRTFHATFSRHNLLKTEKIHSRCNQISAVRLTSSAFETSHRRRIANPTTPPAKFLINIT